MDLPKPPSGPVPPSVPYMVALANYLHGNMPQPRQAQQPQAPQGFADGIGDVTPRFQSNYNAANASLGMNPQEQALYQRHLSNLTGPGGVNNPDGSRSTLFQMNAGIGGQNYNLPTVYDGRVLPPQEAVARARTQGIGNFPSYPTPQAAEDRYQQMHGFMDKDTSSYLSSNNQPSSTPRGFADGTPAVNQTYVQPYSNPAPSDVGKVPGYADGIQNVGLGWSDKPLQNVGLGVSSSPLQNVGLGTSAVPLENEGFGPRRAVQGFSQGTPAVNQTYVAPYSTPAPSNVGRPGEPAGVPAINQSYNAPYYNPAPSDVGKVPGYADGTDNVPTNPTLAGAMKQPTSYGSNAPGSALVPPTPGWLQPENWTAGIASGAGSLSKAINDPFAASAAGIGQAINQNSPVAGLWSTPAAPPVVPPSPFPTVPPANAAGVPGPAGSPSGPPSDTYHPGAAAYPTALPVAPQAAPQAPAPAAPPPQYLNHAAAGYHPVSTIDDSRVFNSRTGQGTGAGNTGVAGIRVEPASGMAPGRMTRWVRDDAAPAPAAPSISGADAAKFGVKFAPGSPEAQAQAAMTPAQRLASSTANLGDMLAQNPLRSNSDEGARAAYAANVAALHALSGGSEYQKAQAAQTGANAQALGAQTGVKAQAFTEDPRNPANIGADVSERNAITKATITQNQLEASHGMLEQELALAKTPEERLKATRDSINRINAILGLQGNILQSNIGANMPYTGPQ